MALSDHTLILKNDGTLWGCGWNGTQYALGLGDTSHRDIFTQITTNTDNIKSVYCGYEYNLILKNDNTLWGCGYNNYGQLGLGNTTDIATFTQITTNTDNIKSVYCGENHTIILKNDGTLWGCGLNTSGQLGLGDTNNRATFTQITTNTDNIKSVYCGASHTFILKNDGTLWGCGNNSYGRLGTESVDNKTAFTIIDSNPGNIKSICCGNDYTLILKNDGTLWGCGNNQYGQLGLGDTANKTIFTKITDNIKSVCCGYAYTIILKNDNTLWGCGRNDYYQLGLGEDKNNKTTFTKIIANINDVKIVYCGNIYTLILKNDGTLWGCGANTYGQLGLGDKTNRNTFTQITTNTDDIKCFANNYPVPPSVIKIYDTKVGYVETLDTNNFRNISVNTVEKLKSLCTNPLDTHLNCLISFDKKQTWKTFDGLNWNTISDISPENIILNCMSVGMLNQLDKNKLISGGFTGDLDFKIAMKTSDVNKTPSITKIYIEYK